MGPARLTKIGKYEILDTIGRGGMGVVYKAIDPAIGRLVAIKMITAGFSDDPNLLKRFYREARSTGTLQHPNIVTVYDLGDDAGTPYLVMEYLEGETLEAVIGSRREMLVAEKLSVMVLACDGLDYAHRRNVVHRDIKPPNIILPKDGGLKIVDFGIARFGNDRFTRTGQVMGSIYYMSPEQINGEESDAGTDIYSTGVVLFEFLTGELPFRGKDTTSTLMKILRDPTPPLSNYLRGYPPDLDQILARALAKSRHDRYPSIEELAFDLQRLQEELRRDLISGYLRSAELCIEQSEWSKAKENLRQILKLDRQNTRANELVRVVQNRIQKQQLKEQVLQLRTRAEEALRLRQWDDAVMCLEQAIALEMNPELVQLRDSIRQRRSDLSQAITRAENAHRAGELEVAQRAIADALAVDPGDTQAKALKAIVSKELADRAKRRQIEDFVAEAHREISAQRFTGALEVLKKAEAVDPAAADVQQLVAFARTARQQQKRKQSLERITAEIEQALNRDEYGAAVSKADQALADFPNDPGLLRLRSFAEKQREIWSRRIHIESQIALAREMLEAGQHSNAADVLKAALLRYPNDANLISLLKIVDEALSQELARTQAERKRKEEEQEIEQTLTLAHGLEQEHTQKAVEVLEEALRRHPNNAQLDVYTAMLRERVGRDKLERERAEREAQRRREGIAAEMRAVRQLMDAKQPGEALQRITEALRNYPESQDLAFYLRNIEAILAQEKKQKELEIAALKQAQIESAAAQARSLLESGMANEATTVLQTALQSLGHDLVLRTLLRESSALLRRQTELAQRERTRPQPDSSNKDLLNESPASATVLFGQSSRPTDSSETASYTREISTTASPPSHSHSTAVTARPPHDLQAEQLDQQPPRASRAQRLQGHKTIFLVASGLAGALIVAAILYSHHPKLVSVRFDITPNGTTISVAGQQCLSPCELELTPGSYQLQASSDGYRSVNQDMEVKAGATNVQSFTLERTSEAASSTPRVVPTPPPAVPSPPSLSTQLEIRGAIPRSEVLVDDRPVGRVDKDGIFRSSVLPGDHQVKFVATGSGLQTKYEHFSSGGSVTIEGREFRALPVQQHQPSEFAEWQQVSNSQDPEQLNQFLRRHPNSPFRAEAEDRLENIYWTRAIASDTSSALMDYLTHYPNGAHSQDATAELAKLDWQAIANTKDVTSLENYLNRHPTGEYHERALNKLDDVIWDLSVQGDNASLRKYLQRFPTGRHANEAKKELDKLAPPKQVATANPTPSPIPDQPRIASPGRDEKGAILGVLKEYVRSYEEQDLNILKKAWPSMGLQQIQGLATFFKESSSVKLTYILLGDPKISGGVATVEFNQEISYVSNGKFQKIKPTKVVMRLTRTSPENTWQIDSIH